MLLELAQWLERYFGAFRLFDYITFRTIMAALTALFVSLFAGPWTIRELTKLKAGQVVRDVLAKLVGDVMTTPVVAASPLTDIRRIARVMLDRDVDGVPIVNEAGVLLGFVSRSDILRAVVTDPPLSMWR